MRIIALQQLTTTKQESFVGAKFHRTALRRLCLWFLKIFVYSFTSKPHQNYLLLFWHIDHLFFPILNFPLLKQQQRRLHQNKHLTENSNKQKKENKKGFMTSLIFISYHGVKYSTRGEETDLCPVRDSLTAILRPSTPCSPPPDDPPKKREETLRPNPERIP